MSRMEHFFQIILFLSMSIVFSLSCPGIGCNVNAADDTLSNPIMPTRVTDTGYHYTRHHSLYTTSEGIVRVCENDGIWVETYDENYELQSKKYIELELPIWGGIFVNQEFIYVVEGQNNDEQDDDKEVIRVIKYDKGWNRLDAAIIKSGNSSSEAEKVRYPFDTGCVEMTEENGNLYIVTGHEGYIDKDIGRGHQGYLMVKIDEKNMNGEIVDSDLGHSFAQYICSDESNIYVAELSEGKECACVSEVSFEGERKKVISLLKYGGQRTSSESVPTYSTVNGIALSSENVLTLGTSIDQERYNDKFQGVQVPFNLYLTITPRDSFTSESTRIEWLTNYSDSFYGFLNAEISSIEDDRFLISWEAKRSDYITDDLEKCNLTDESDLFSWHELHYVIIDGDGNILCDDEKVNAAIASCKPVINNNEMVFCTACDFQLNFYSINADTGTFNKHCIRMISDQATWDCNDGNLIISGIGSVSFSGHGYSYVPLTRIVTSITLENGIDSISRNAFVGFHELTSLELPDTLIEIDGYAFDSCYALHSITLPNSLEYIADNAFDYYGDPGKSIRRENLILYGYPDSYAALFAQTTGYNFIPLELPSSIMQGDANADGKFNVADVVLLQKWLLAVPGTHLANWKAADLCEDNRLDVFDLCMMKRKLING